MIFQAKRLASPCLPVLAALLATAIPPTALSQIPMRGFRSDLSSTADKFLSLDLNGDGKADMLYYRPGGGYAGAYLSHGDGTFRQVAYTTNGSATNGFRGDLSNPQDAFVALDLNGDGKSDFIQYRPGSGYTFKCLSNGDGTVNCVSLSEPGQQYFGFRDAMTNGAERIVAMDLNHDGRSDFIVYAPGAGFARAYLSLANGNVQPIDLSVNGAGNPSAGFYDDMKPSSARIVPIDADGDGYADLLVYTPQYSEVRLYLNNRNNGFTLVSLAYGGATSNGFTGNASDPNSHLIALDLNGDGRQDFLWWQAGSRTVVGYLSRGNGSFTGLNYQFNGSMANGFQDNDNSPADTAVALDLNGDGKQDFLWYSPGNSIVTAYTSSSTGALTAASYRSGTGTAQNFQTSQSTQSDTALPLNFLGQAGSGFAWYVPGSGTFQAYNYNSATLKLNYYNFYAYPSSFLSDLNWSIGNIPAKEIVMPGTHDAAMYGLNYGPIDLSETQWGDLPYQLDNGARYFDFRTGYYRYNSGAPKDVNGKFAFIDTPAVVQSDAFLMYGHSSILTGYQPRTLISQVENWLVAHPSEVVYLDLSNQNIAGSELDMTNQFVYELQHTEHPDLIYTQYAACGSNRCTDPKVQPQNVSINQMKTKGGGYYGARLVLINTPDALTKLGWGWQGVKDSQVGYCGSGVTFASMEIDCINNGDNNAPSIQAVRPNYWAADASPNFTQMVAVLTPFGAGGGALAPLQFADGTPGIGGFNNGNDGNDFNQQLMSGAWNVNALNMVTIDGLGHDDVSRLLIQRNRQTWTNAHFFNTKADNAAGALSIGANGDIWAAGAGHSIVIYKYNPANGAWVSKITGMPNVKKLATDLQGGVWVVDGSAGFSSPTGRLIHYDLNGQNPNVSNSVVQDVAVGKNGSVWAMGADGSIFEVTGPTDGSADIRASVPTQYGARLAVDNMGRPWVIDNNGYIQRFNGSSWQQVSSSRGKEIVAAADGSVFVTGSNDPSIGRYNVQYNNFDFLLMDAAHIAVEPGGQPWAIRQITGTVYKGSLDQM